MFVRHRRFSRFSLFRLTIWLGLCLMALLFAALGALQASEPGQPHVAQLTVQGAIGPATTDYLVRSMDRARDAGARAIVIRMDTPGGLDAATRDIIQALLESPVPVITYVHPAGARAASAGTYILYGSHIAAMTPATNLGAATPVQMGSRLILQAEENGTETNGPEQNGGVIDDIMPDDSLDEEDEPLSESAMERKVINDSVAFIRGLAERHGRNADWAEEAVREAASLTAREALELNVIDIMAPNLEDLLAQADGREVQMAQTTEIIEVADLPVLDYEPDWRSELLGVITNPQIAYILLLIGIYGLILEGYNPGAMLPGIVGAISLLLALYALQMLPVNYVGLALIVLGALLIVAEAFAPSFGVLGFGGVTALLLGSLMLIDTDAPGIEMPYEIIGGIALVSSVAVLYVVVAVSKTMRMKTVPSNQAMVGREGKVRTVGPDGVQVLVSGERWMAHSDTPLSEGQTVTVTRQEGLALEVSPVDSTSKES